MRWRIRVRPVASCRVPSRSGVARSLRERCYSGTASALGLRLVLGPTTTDDQQHKTTDADDNHNTQQTLQQHRQHTHRKQKPNTKQNLTTSSTLPLPLCFLLSCFLFGLFLVQRGAAVRCALPSPIVSVGRACVLVYTVARCMLLYCWLLSSAGPALYRNPLESQD